MRTSKDVPLGMVTARAAKGVSKTQIRVRVKVVTSLVIFVGSSDSCEVAGFVKSVQLVAEFVDQAEAFDTVSCSSCRWQTQFMVAFASLRPGASAYAISNCASVKADDRRV